MLGHPAFRDEPGDFVDIDLAPDAALAAARVALQITLVVKALAHRVDPAPAEANVDRLLGCDRLQARAHFVNPDPDLDFLVVVHAEPPIEGDGVLECLDLSGIDFDRRHQDTLTDVTLSMPAPPAGPVPARITFRTNRGSSCAITCEIKPPSEKPRRSTFPSPNARMNATASCAIAATEFGVEPSDAPTPRLSKAMTRRLDAMPSTTRGSHLSSSAAR